MQITSSKEQRSTNCKYAGSLAIGMQFPDVLIQRLCLRVLSLAMQQNNLTVNWLEIVAWHVLASSSLLLLQCLNCNCCHFYCCHCFCRCTRCCHCDCCHIYACVIIFIAIIIIVISNVALIVIVIVIGNVNNVSNNNNSRIIKTIQGYIEANFTINCNAPTKFWLRRNGVTKILKHLTH